MALETGASVGPYQILGSLGAGGMGEVYRARDSRLDRTVAIKILPDSFAADTDRVARFEREAKMLAAMNHPNVAQIYGLEDLNGRRALSMEFVDGENLAQRLRRGALPLDEALAIARQIADGLDAAHEIGIVHRDLKPSNVQLRADGTAKILDFGLAKALAPATSSVDVVSSPTITSPSMTARGVGLGTAAYMAPEQAKGKPVDKRADIWAFGAVLYEMVTGRRAFEGDDVSELLASVLKLEPEWSSVPPSLHRLLRSCLEKDPRKRLRDIADWSRLLDAPSPSGPRGNARASWGAWGLAAAALIASATLALVLVRERAREGTALSFQVAAPPGNSFETFIALAPDGRRLAFTARDSSGVVRFWIRDLDALDARPLPGTEGARSGFWSPDNRSLAFSVGRELKRIDIAGGAVVTLYTAPTVGELGTGSWNSEGDLIIGGYIAGAIRRIPKGGGEATPLTALDRAHFELAHGLPEFLPDGRHFLYFRVSRDASVNGVYVGSIDDAPAQQSATRLVATDQRALYASSGSNVGHLLFLQKGVLMAQPFDTTRLTLTDQPIPVVDGVSNFGALGFVSAAEKVLAYRSGRVAAGGRLSQLAWLDRKGTTIAKVGEAGTYTGFDLSPDGSRAVLVDAVIAERDLWTMDTARGITTRLLSNPAIELGGVWSPDTKRVAFASNRNGRYDVFIKETGEGREEVFLQSDANKTPTSWSSDGRFLLFTEQQQGSGDVYLVPVEGDRKPIALLHSEFDEGAARFSPDLRWITYTSNESGRAEVYVRPFDASAPAARGDYTRLSKDGGDFARWRRDSKEVFFAEPNGGLMSIAITPTPGLPARLFTMPSTLSQYSLWDVSPDGGRFLVGVPEESSGLSPINVLVNWKAK
jgi:Tol biopolymer transport system component